MKQYVKSPDLNAPRYRKRPYHVDKSKLHKEFIKKYPEYKGLTSPQFKEIIYQFNELTRDAAVKERSGIALPEGLGHIFIGSCKPSTRRGNVSPVLSSKHNQKVKNTNMHTDSKVCKIFYTNYIEKYRFKNRDLWTFSGHRNFTRSASKAFTEHWERYVIVEPYMKVNNMYRKRKNRDYAKMKEKETLDSYNEFEFD